MRETQTTGEGPGLDWLKSRPKRSLYREQHPRLGPVVVKRFHDPSTLGRLHDRRRVRKEARTLRHWNRLGFPVPFPVEVRTHGSFFELVMPAIEGAQSLSQVLEAGPAPQGLAQRVGTLLAHMDRAGLVQGDLHPGNLLLDPAGEPWLIDPTPAPLFSGRAARDRNRWVRLCASVREVCRPPNSAPAAWPPTAVPQVPPPPVWIGSASKSARATFVSKTPPRGMPVGYGKAGPSPQSHPAGWPGKPAQDGPHPSRWKAQPKPRNNGSA